MKTYKDFDTRFIGESDIASLTLRSPDSVGILRFCDDGAYDAYIVTEEAEIGAHYHEVFRCRTWLWIFDDQNRTITITAPEIIVYRAGLRGCIIYAPDGKVV